MEISFFCCQYYASESMRIYKTSKILVWKYLRIKSHSAVLVILSHRDRYVRHILVINPGYELGQQQIINRPLAVVAWLPRERDILSIVERDGAHERQQRKHIAN